MNTLKIIEGQSKDFEDRFVKTLNWSNGNLQAIIVEKDSNCIYDWHKQSIVQILESEVERRRGMRKEEYYSCAMHGSIDGVLCECIGETFGYNQAIQEDITHLTNLLDSLK